jgi:hypothetical protein
LQATNASVGNSETPSASTARHPATWVNQDCQGKKKNRDNWVAEGFVALLKELRRIRALRFFKKRDKICQSIFWPGRIT